ncbi:MAG: hypothetical protein IJZ84_04465 [Lachnospiraceae bacterium]|nr:hypothetical protein [Lachnospiraceae bacterium]
MEELLQISSKKASRVKFKRLGAVAAVLLVAVGVFNREDRKVNERLKNKLPIK